MKRKDLTGKRFGRLTVIEYVGTKHDKNGKNARAQWKCQCDCGNIRIVESASLLLGRSKSCGCLCREENSKRMKQQIKERGCYIARLQEQLKEANDLLKGLYDDSPCQFDHNGYCQEHGSTDGNYICVQGELKEYLERYGVK